MNYNRPETEREKHTQKLLNSTPRLAEWVNSLPENERENAKDCLIFSFCVTPTEVIKKEAEARERRRKNRPHAQKILTHLQNAIDEAHEIDNNASIYIIKEISELHSDIKRIFIDKGDRKQKSGWHDYARFIFHQLFSSTNNENRITPFSKPLRLRELDYLLILQSAIGARATRDAVKNWIKRENMPLDN